MKKKLSILLAGLLMAAMTVVPKFPVYAAGLSIALSNQDLKVGDTFTATISVPGGGSSQVALSYDSSVISFDSSSVTSSGGDGEKMISVDGAKGTVTFTVVGSGSTSLTATSTSGTDSSGAAADYSAAGVVVKAAGSQEDSDTDPTNGDNSLSSLSLSDGTLSPEFSYKTTKYTASVDYDVTSIDVSAIPSNSSATIDSITGTDNLQVGNNTVMVVVKAGNGSTATYTINVERKEQSEDAEEENQPEEQQSADGSKVFTINGQNYIPADTIPEEVIPADFSESSVSIDGTDYPALSFTKAELTLLYLIPENSEDAGKLYIYNTNDGNEYPFVLLHTDSHYAIVRNPDAASIPEGFTQMSVTVGETENVTAYHRNDAAETPDSDFYYLYCLNDQGQNYWYQYDNAEGTYQRYAEQLDNSSEQQNENEQYNEAMNQLEKMKQKNRYMIFGMIFGAAILIIIIINLLIARKDQNGLDDAYDDPDEDDDVDDLEDDEEDDDEEDDDELNDEEDVHNPEDDSEEDGGNNASEENVAEATEESGAAEPEIKEPEKAEPEQQKEKTESEKPEQKKDDTMVIPSSNEEDEQFSEAAEQVQSSYHEENVRVKKRSLMDKFLDKMEIHDEEEEEDEEERETEETNDDDDDIEFLDLK